VLAGALVVSGYDPASAAIAQSAPHKPNVQPLRVVSTPNPNIFALLLAKYRHPSLPLVIVPVADGKGIDQAFADAKGDALASMTYTAAQKVATGKVPDLRLVRVTLWRGFFAVTPSESKVHGFRQLVGKGVLIAGPTSGGRDGGPDLLFRAAIRRAGYSVKDFHICYLPVKQAAALIAKQQPMNSNPACDAQDGTPASAISLIAPASSGLVMQGMMPTGGAHPMTASIDMQSLFTGFTSWPADQLPHGGLSIRSAAINDRARRAAIREVLDAYDEAVSEIADAGPLKRIQIARIISDSFAKTFKPYGLELPVPVVVMSLSKGDLVLRSDLAVSAVKSDLDRFLAEVVGTPVPPSFTAQKQTAGGTQ
jgi:ABC-type nitrate/sulfonate/bicarbonate transport system substrate-binding protein